MYDTLALDANLSGPLRATLKGIPAADAGLPLSLSLDSPSLRWPLGNARLSGEQYGAASDGERP